MRWVLEVWGPLIEASFVIFGGKLIAVFSALGLTQYEDSVTIFSWKTKFFLCYRRTRKDTNRYVAICAPASKMMTLEH